MGTGWMGPKLYTGRVRQNLTPRPKSLFMFISIHLGARSSRQSKESGTRDFTQNLLACFRDRLFLGMSAIDADNPSLNCGTGSCLNAEGKVECDAAIMDADKGLFGAVAAVEGVKNPIKVASALLRSQLEGPRNQHGLYRPVFLAGDGARKYAVEKGIELCHKLITDEMKTFFSRIKQNYDTVGVIVVDSYGHLALGTSSGGRWLKEAGRVGSSPIFGAGFWSGRRRNTSVALCLTGVGEVILCRALAATIGAEILTSSIDGRFERLCCILESIPSEVGVMLLALDEDGRAELWIATSHCGLPYGFIQGQDSSFYSDFSRGKGIVRISCHSVKL